MKLVIISGRSGSGKSISLRVLEDLGYYCVDNLPVDMLPGLVEKFKTKSTRLAVSIDARNLPMDPDILKEVLHQLKQTNIICEIIYLDADQKVLLRRFSETRRRHPLTNDTTSLQEAIEQEKILLNPLTALADTTFDTTYLSHHQLCQLIRDRVDNEHLNQLHLLIQSFGFKNGMPSDADFVFDVRCLPNPYWQSELREKTGQDPSVCQFLSEHPDVEKMIHDIFEFLKNWIPRFEADNRSYLTVCIGCTGGKHRSVYITEQLAEKAKMISLDAQVRHRDLEGK